MKRKLIYFQEKLNKRVNDSFAEGNKFEENLLEKIRN